MIISSPDTDVAVISCYHYFTTFQTSLNELWFKTGTGNKLFYLSIHETATSLGPCICRILPALHSITGCDSVSSFSAIGKTKSVNVLKANVDQLVDMFEFGDSPELCLGESSVEASIKFACLLYDSKFISANINQLRL